MTITIEEYSILSEGTDKLDPDDDLLVRLGLNGEIGSVLSALKKHRRDNTPSGHFLKTVEQEIGDAIWYLAALCRRCSIDFVEIARASGELGFWNDQHSVTDCKVDLASDLIGLNRAGSDALSGSANREQIAKIFYGLTMVAKNIGANGPRILFSNIEKIQSRFEGAWVGIIDRFDDDFPEDERLPRQFSIDIRKKPGGVTYLIYNGVKIGDPLRDNARDPDGYRFHDVFHLTNAAVLGWSPVFRAMLKNKRKSDTRVDDTEDSGRAIVVEEGLTAWAFSNAKDMNFFADVSSLSYDFLSNVQAFVRGLEVERCPLWLWQRSILTGYQIFRQIRSEGEGRVVGDLYKRSAWFESLHT